ncbi:DUF3488 and DUF4129 domain-containing transglutaminase family protein [Zoogloea sp.]|uniref:transglutaminase TgpA family protein n=1 Tax=Zoogloea sp. TaxID=49181 RepID=UPI0035AF7971
MAEARLRPDQAGWLIACSAISLTPHGQHLPPAITAVCILLLLWRTAISLGKGHLPHRLLLVGLSATVVGLVLLEYHQFFGKDPGIAVLAGLLSLKLLETDSRRDGRAVLLLCLFMQTGQFLYQQSMQIAALALLGATVAIGSLLALQGQPAALKARLTSAARLVLQGVPLMLVLFVLFPRVQGPLWGLPADAYNRVSGLSDSMTPGDMARLSESSEIAFRAAFSGELPPPAERYWRGPVLSRFDGRSWRAARSSTAPRPAYAPQGVAYPYTLTLEPHNQRWLLALDFPAEAPGLRYGSDFQLMSSDPVRSRLRLSLRSYPHTPVGVDASPLELREALALPSGSNPRTQALGARIQQEARDADDALQRVIADFRRRGLSYTLDPQPLGREDADSFLFDTKQGFCEHFSSAFVIAMRAAGVPARVVTGYQGGEFNPVDGTLVIRQSDAHAWAEVWLAGRGWKRVDPTAASAPRRIDGGLAAALPDSDRLPLLSRSSLAWLRELRNQLDALDNRWNQWVLGYNPARQKALLADFGVKDADWQTITALMGGACTLVMAALTAWVLRRRLSADALDRSWSLFCRRLASAGLPRAAWEGPQDYAERVASQRPDLADTVKHIATDYARLRYGRAGIERAALQSLKHSIKNFRPR